MLNATTSPTFTDFSFYEYKKNKHCTTKLVFWRGYCVHHFSIAEFYNYRFCEYVCVEMTFSPYLGRTANNVSRAFPYLKPNTWEPATWFFEMEPDLQTYIAGRLEFFKEFTADHHVSARLIKMLLEAK